jgi:hypothetical protein
MQYDTICELCKDMKSTTIKPRPHAATDEDINNFTPLTRNRWLEIKDGEIVMKFGMHKGRLLSEVAEQDPTYLDWMLTIPVSGLSKPSAALA